MPRLSVVIPTFNTAAMTLACCRAALASAQAEVIVVDDGSTDGTARLLAAEDVRVVRLEENRGFATAANRGVAEAKGDIVLLLNSDAVVQPGALHAFVDAFENDPKLGVAGARLLNDDGTPQWSGGRTPTLLWMLAAVTGLGRFARFFRRRRNGTPPRIDWVSGAAMAFRREAWNDAGPLNESYRFYCQDLEFCLRAATTWDVRIVENARVVHGLGKTIGKAKDKLRDDLLAWGRSHYGRTWWLFARIVL